MTTYIIGPVAFNKCNVKHLKSIFKRSFGESWKNAISDRKDKTFVVYKKNRIKPVAFCMIHDTPPYEFKCGSGVYMYNLCVDPEFRDNGIGTQLVNKVKEYFGNKNVNVHFHTKIDDTRAHQWMVKRGFYLHNEWKHLLESSTIGTKTVFKQTEYTHYDPVENLIYMEEA